MVGVDIVSDGTYNETVLYQGITTSDGNVGRTTLVDSALIGENDFLTDTTIIIMTGVCRRETRDIDTFAAGSGTITVGTAFSAQIVSGVSFAVIARMSADVEVNALQADVGDASASTLGSLYAILGNPSASVDTTLLNGIDARVNNPTLNALLGVTDAAGRSINGNIGDFQARANLITLLASLGIPDVAGKDLYTLLVTDRLDNATYGLSALETLVDDLETRLTAARAGYLDELAAANLPADIDIIKADTQTIEDSTLKASPTAGSLARYVASGGTALGTQLPDSKSLYDCLSGGVTVVDRVAGKRQVFVKAITVAANAGATVVGTITTQPCVIESITIHANTAQTANLTSCAVTGGASGIITFINAAIAIQANLDTIDKQVSWTGSVRLGATKTIVITLVGIAATALDLTIIITYYSSAVSGGYII